jgi:hypothetical protein
LGSERCVTKTYAGSAKLMGRQMGNPVNIIATVVPACWLSLETYRKIGISLA